MTRARVLYIYGAGPQPPAPELRAELDAVLFPDAEGPPTDIAWYGDVTDALRGDRAAAQRPDSDTGQAPAGDLATDAAPAHGPARPVNESGRAPDDEPGLDDRLVAHARALWLETRGLAGRATDVRGSLLLRLVAAMGSVDDRETPGPEDRHGSRSEAIWHFFRDVSGYLENDLEIAPLLRARVRDAIERNPGPLLIVAHSLGTVIAFDVL